MQENKVADTAAKEVALMFTIPNLPIPIFYFKHLIYTKLQHSYINTWKNTTINNKFRSLTLQIR